jgi:hypothetical protein
MANCCSAEPGRRHNGSTRRRRQEINSASRRFRSHGLETRRKKQANCHQVAHKRIYHRRGRCRRCKNLLAKVFLRSFYILFLAKAIFVLFLTWFHGFSFQCTFFISRGLCVRVCCLDSCSNVYEEWKRKEKGK